MGLVLSGCCVHCQQPVEMLRLLSGAPCFMSESCKFGECHCLFAMYVLSGGLCVCVHVCVHVCVCVCVCEVGTCVCVCSIEWKLRVDLVLSGCCVRCQQPVEMLRLVRYPVFYE